MQVPTVLVRMRESGHECVVNASDFDPAIHEDMAGQPKQQEAGSQAESGPGEPEESAKKSAKGKK